MNQKAIDSFDRAADRYHQSSQVQRQVAARLLQDCRAACPQPGSIFEIGCGTGNLTRLMIDAWPEANVLATDASQSMVAQCRAECGVPTEPQPDVRFEHFTAGRDTLNKSYDLIVSNMALQWLDDLQTTVRELLQHCEYLAFTIPIDGSFAAWIDAHRTAGLEPGIRELMPASHLSKMLNQLPATVLQLQCDDFEAAFATPLEFVRSLRQAGTSTPKDQHRPVSLRRVFAMFPDGFVANYRIASVVLQSR